MALSYCPGGGRKGGNGRKVKYPDPLAAFRHFLSNALSIWAKRWGWPSSYPHRMPNLERLILDCTAHYNRADPRLPITTVCDQCSDRIKQHIPGRALDRHSSWRTSKPATGEEERRQPAEGTPWAQGERGRDGHPLRTASSWHGCGRGPVVGNQDGGRKELCAWISWVKFHRTLSRRG